MEKNRFITIFFVIAIIFSACDEKLNLEPAPVSTKIIQRDRYVAHEL